jgi:cobalt-zinc-cadmium efflux system membrane fusion protein
MKPYFVIVISCVGFGACSSKPVSTAEGVVAARSENAVLVDARTQRQLGLEVQPAEALSVAAPIAATGQLQVNEDRTWTVGAVTEGRIVAVPVRLGETVKTGQIVAQMHSHEVHDGRATRRQAVAELEKLKVLSEQARRVLDRTRRLLDLKAASREQLEAADTQYRSAEFSVTNAEAEVQKTEAHLTEFLDVSLQDPGKGGNAADAQDYVPIKSPAFGTVMEKLANVGTVVSIATPVVKISDLSSLWLIAAVNEADLSLIRPRQAVRISVRAYPDKTFPGTVFQLGERLDPQTRTLQVRVLVANLNGLLKPDMFATADFTPALQSRSIHVLESAVQELNGKSVVFIRSEKNAFRAKEVKVGSRVAGQIEILSGLEPGTPVVINGALLLKSQLLKSEGN